MSEFLLEIISEAVPPRMQMNAFALNEVFQKILLKHCINFITNIKISPTRIIIYARSAPINIKISEKIIKGPSVNSSREAINGFLLKYDITEKDLNIDDGYYQYKSPEKHIMTKEVLCNNVMPEFFLQAQKVWPETMVWNESNYNWIRPIRGINLIFDSKIIDFTIAGVKTPYSVNINTIDEYFRQISKLNIVMSSSIDEKITYIKEKIYKILPNNLVFDENDKVLKDIAGLCSNPNPLIACFPERFLSIPKEVIESLMHMHQKYLPLYHNGDLSSYFVIVADREFASEEERNSVIKGNIKVMLARLSDADFFYNKDLNTDAKLLVEKLKKVHFHDKLGSLYDRIERVKSLAFKICRANESLQKRIYSETIIMNLDLCTEITSEFPELTGIALLYYKHKWCNDLDIEDFTQISHVVHFANQLEYANSLLDAGEKPTSSRDPLGIFKAIDKSLEIAISYYKEVSCDLKDFVIPLDTNHDVLEYMLKKLQKYYKTCALERMNKYLKSQDVDLFTIFNLNDLYNKIESDILDKINIIIKRIKPFLSVNFDIIDVHNEKIIDCSNILFGKINMSYDYSGYLKIFDSILKNPQEIKFLLDEILSFIDNNMILDDDSIKKNFNLTILHYVYNKFLSFFETL